MTHASILLVDDQKSVLHFMSKIMETEGHTVYTAESVASGIELFEKHDPDFTILDLRLPDGSGLDVLKKAREINKNAFVLMVTGSSDVTAAVQAMRLGAYDYLPKPVDVDHLLLIVRRVLQLQKDADVLDHLRRSQKAEFGIDFIFSPNSAIVPLLETVKQVAESDSTSVLIEGESGTGKELIAHILHQQSARSKGPFLDINCASLPEELLESELFGHEKGAYTDAHSQKKGLLELADGGTLFLDELGEMSLTIQVKLLRVLEKMSFRRVGGVRDISVSVRIVSATNRELMEEVRRGAFREDLYYRLKVVPMTLPPLRERHEDIPLLAMHFLNQFNSQFRKSFRGFTPEAHDLLLRYPWPGNIREMRNLLERTILLSKGEWIDELMLSLPGGSGGGPESEDLRLLFEAAEGKIPLDGITLQKHLEWMEKEIILQASEKTNWNQTRTAKLLHMNRDKLRYRMKQYGLDREPSHSA